MCRRPVHDKTHAERREGDVNMKRKIASTTLGIVFVCLLVCLAFIHIYPRRVSMALLQKPSKRLLYKPAIDVVALAQQLYSTSETVFVTFASASFFEDVINLKYSLRRPVLLMCLDSMCIQNCTDHGFLFCTIASTSADSGSLAAAKFGAVVNLTSAGFNTVLFDLDAYITQDPVEAMLPLSDPSWDVQVQRNFPAPSKDLNFGWVYTRSTNITTVVWQHCLKKYTATKDWDQVSWHFALTTHWHALACHDKGHRVLHIHVCWGVSVQAVFNLVFQDAEQKGLIKLWRLPVETFSQMMNLNFPALYEREHPEDMADDRVVMHMTCAEGSNVKRHLARVFGVWRDRGYYCLHRTIAKLPDEYWRGSAQELNGRIHAASMSIIPVILPKYLSVSDRGQRLVPPVRAIQSSLLSSFLEYNFINNAYRLCEQVEVVQGSASAIVRNPGSVVKAVSKPTIHVVLVRNVTVWQNPSNSSSPAPNMLCPAMWNLTALSGPHCLQFCQ